MLGNRGKSSGGPPRWLGAAAHNVPGEAEGPGFVQFGKRRVGRYPESSTI